MSLTSAGPFPLMMLVALAAILVAWLFARGTTPAEGGLRGRAGSVVVDAVLLGVVGARLAHVTLHAGDYLAAPLSIIRLGDGGYAPWAGVLVAAAYALWRTRRELPRKPVLLGLAAGGAFWLMGAMVLFAVQRSTVVLPELVLHDMQGAPVALAERNGRPLVLNLWASWCGPCRREMPVLVQARAAHPQIDFVFANQGEEVADVLAYLQAEAMAADGIVLDPDSALMRETGARALPTTLFFAADGRLHRVHLGELSKATLEARLRELQ